MKSQKEIINQLSKEEQQILQHVMTLEQTNLYIKDLKENRSKEKEVIENVVKLIEKEIRNEN
ncbi:hypothetical protein Q4601_11995 [Shewanella sp. 1_MG-2023]|uniref:hypothetical protein n=1 Tax=unclassified Shewanella TaxID=196818 RepID=UPI0026E2B317|nr:MULTISPECIES: hypothetical protein [unclassified Shewanella]MDO6610522.1 hypothetical protein [Shewanella sp. 7_MG-2023]MDO6770647.1 hypothetical protein [Shewanella sp. 2_MG-2023]MDO6795033.1 hypothetical protein [Shewanella sp. 1_MG-2023]